MEKLLLFSSSFVLEHTKGKMGQCWQEGSSDGLWFLFRSLVFCATELTEVVEA